MKSFSSELDDLRSRGLFRTMRTVSGPQSGRVTIEGRPVLLLCSNNYLGLADDGRLIDAACDAARQYGVSSGASRLVSGTMDVHAELERCIASFKGTDAALLFNSGYAANTGIMQAIAGRDDTVYCDRLNHASIIDGIMLSRARFARYPHGDARALRTLLEHDTTRGRRIIFTDGVFSMDGDIAPLREITVLSREFDCLLVVDDAHGGGVLGREGRGVSEMLDVADHIDIHMGTLGKAFGSTGAYAAASREIVDMLVNRARSFIFSTALPPHAVAPSIAAIEIVRSSEGISLRDRLRSNANHFRRCLNDAGFKVPDGITPIIPVVIGDETLTIEFSRRLLDKGVFVQGIRPPTVPAGTSRLRCTVMATHSKDEMDEAADAVIATGRELGVIA